MEIEKIQNSQCDAKKNGQAEGNVTLTFKLYYKALVRKPARYRHIHPHPEVGGWNIYI